MPVVYLFSGLGADARVFRFLRLPGVDLHVIEWEKPERGEWLEAYTRRLLPQIKEKDAVLLGLSFGGIVAIEAAKQLGTQKLILISSFKSRRELPPLYKLAGKMGLHKLVPPAALKYGGRVGGYLFGVKKNEDRRMVESLIKDTDYKFLQWAWSVALKWRNEWLPPQWWHFHGSADRILPIRYIRNCIPIAGGTHFMIVNKSRRLSEEIMKILNENESPTK